MMTVDMDEKQHARGWIRSWPWVVAALLYTVFMYATLPVAPRVWFWLLPRLQPHLTLWFLATGSVALVGLAVRAWTAARRRRWVALAVLVLVAGLYVTLLFGFYADVAPAKKAHLMEYGVLAYLACAAVVVEPGGGPGFFLAATYLLVAGVVDEGIQALLPMRFFGVKDIIGNWLAAVLGMLVWTAASPISPWRCGRERDQRRV